jgi:hypothetical protein
MGGREKVRENRTGRIFSRQGRKERKADMGIVLGGLGVLARKGQSKLQASRRSTGVTVL